MLDWGLRLVLLLAVPCTMALLVFAQPLVAVLYQRGAFTAHDVQQTTAALMGYGAGLLGIVAIKVLAPGFYASQDIRTPCASPSGAGGHAAAQPAVCAAVCPRRADAGHQAWVR
jgi:peptidoglycan biosynthesis protein MviN/MurJ (putative lipid II flippase)